MQRIEGERAAGVVQATSGGEGGAAVGGDVAAVVGERALYVNAAVGRERGGGRRVSGGRCVRRLVGRADAPAAAVGEVSGGNVQPLPAALADAALVVVERSSGNIEALADKRAAVLDRVGGGECECARCFDAAGVVERVRLDG